MFSQHLTTCGSKKNPPQLLGTDISYEIYSENYSAFGASSAGASAFVSSAAGASAFGVLAMFSS